MLTRTKRSLRNIALIVSIPFLVLGVAAAISMLALIVIVFMLATTAAWSIERKRN